ncbi:MAG: hypothetical protein WCJ69_09100 [Betaproteobacteria bacterium]|jgi:hypothetical protein
MPPLSTARRLFILSATTLALVASSASPAAEDPVATLYRVHDWKTSVAVGNRYLKQQALVATRDVLARLGREQDLGKTWKRGNPDFDAAENAIMEPMMDGIRRDWTSLVWMPPEWTAVARESFTPAEVDTLLAHFQSEIGRKQARIIDHAVAFHVAGAFNLSGKVIQDYPGTEAEHKALTYVWDEEDREMRFSIAQGENVEGQRFALSPLGAKYQKTLVIKVTGILNARVDRVAADLPAQARAWQFRADAFIAAFRTAGAR